MNKRSILDKLSCIGMTKDYGGDTDERRDWVYSRTGVSGEDNTRGADRADYTVAPGERNRKESNVAAVSGMVNKMT